MSIKDACNKRTLYTQGDTWDVNVISAGGIAQYDKGDVVGVTDTGIISLVENSVTGLYDNLVLGEGASSRALRVTLADEDKPDRGDPYGITTNGIQSLAVRNDYPAAPLANNVEYIPLTTDEVGSLRIGVYQTYDMALRRGLILGHEIVEQNGVLTDLDTTIIQPNLVTPVTVWPGANLYTGYYTAAEPLIVTSNNANDAAAGTGARTVTLTNLLDSLGAIQPNITLTVGGAASGANYSRCHGCFVATAGTANTNIGTITVSGSVSGKVYSIIHPRKAESTQCTYTVPLGKTLFLQCIRGTTGIEANGQGNILTRFIVFALRYGSFSGILKEKFTFADVKPGGTFTKELMGLQFTQGTDIEVDIIHTSDLQNDNMYLTAGFVGYLIDN